MFPNASLVILYTSKTCNTWGHNVTRSKSLLLVNRTRQTHNKVHGLIERFSTVIKSLFYSTSKVENHKSVNVGTTVIPAFNGQTAYRTEWKEEGCVVRRVFCSWWCIENSQHPTRSRTMTLTRNFTKLLGTRILMLSVCDWHWINIHVYLWSDKQKGRSRVTCLPTLFSTETKLCSTETYLLPTSLLIPEQWRW
jgi:hypothetical protein